MLEALTTAVRLIETARLISPAADPWLDEARAILRDVQGTSSADVRGEG